MDTSTLIIIAVPCGTALCIVGIVASLCFCVHSRRKPLKRLVPIHYIPFIPPVVPEVIVFKSPMNKREKRKMRMRQLEIREKLRKITQQANPEVPTSPRHLNGEGAIDDDHPETNDALSSSMPGNVASADGNHANTKRSVIIGGVKGGIRGSMGMLTRSVSTLFKRTSADNDEDMADDELMQRALSLAHDIENQLGSSRNSRSMRGSTSSLRKSMSPSRMSKIEKRREYLKRRSMQFSGSGEFAEFYMNNEDEDSDEGENGGTGPFTILDMDDNEEKRRLALVAKRKAEREQKRSNTPNNQTSQELISMNSGPPASSIPVPYIPIHDLFTLDPAVLVYKRCMYYVQFEETYKPSGWYMGTIISVCSNTGKNFNIKFDRKETGTLFVDGMHSVWLSLDGEQAYGRKWILLERTDGKRR
eukprot:gene26338-31816_t